MVIGHAAVAFAAKRVEPTMSLGWLMAASLLPDSIWGILVSLDIEKAQVVPTGLRLLHQPYSHSLATTLAASSALAALYFAIRRFPKGAWITAALVSSHWLLDALWHRPVLQLLPGYGVRVGIGLTANLPVAIAIELGLLAVGLRLYVRASPAPDLMGRLGLWGMVFTLLAATAMDRFGLSLLNTACVAAAGAATFGLAIWAAWVDAHRWEIIDTKLERRTFSQ